MARLGLTSYRFSVSWPRITPHVTADALGPVNPDGAGVLLRAGRRAARRRHLTVGHALPLGPAAGPRGRRRLDRRGARPSGSPSTPRSSPPRSATGCRCSSRSTSRGAAPTSATPAACTPRAAPTTPPRSPRCTTSTSPTGSPRRAVRRGRARGARGAHAQPGAGCARRPDSPQDAEAARRVDGLQNRVFLDPCCTAATPPTCSPTPRPSRTGRSCSPATSTSSPRPWTCWASTTTPPPPCGTGRASGPRRHADGHGDGDASPWIACDDVEFPCQHGRRDRHGLEHRPARADRAAAAGGPRGAGPGDHGDGERRRVPRRRARRRPRRRHRPHRLPPRAPRRRARRDRGRRAR